MKIKLSDIDGKLPKWDLVITLPDGTEHATNNATVGTLDKLRVTNASSMADAMAVIFQTPPDTSGWDYTLGMSVISAYTAYLSARMETIGPMLVAIAKAKLAEQDKPATGAVMMTMTEVTKMVADAVAAHTKTAEDKPN